MVEFVKELLQPSWKAKQIDRDAFRLITRKVTEKVPRAAVHACCAASASAVCLLSGPAAAARSCRLHRLRPGRISRSLTLVPAT